MVNLEMKWKVIKDYEGEKSVMVIACQSGMCHCTRVTDLNKNKVMEAGKKSASMKATRRNKNSRRAYI